jgi:hypothetical protein
MIAASERPNRDPEQVNRPKEQRRQNRSERDRTERHIGCSDYGRQIIAIRS